MNRQQLEHVLRASASLSPVDLAISKQAAGRSKDLDFVRGMLKASILEKSAVERALDELPVDAARSVRNFWEICASTSSTSPD